MAILIEAQNLSRGWLTALEALRQSGGKALHLSVSIASPGVEDDGIRNAIDVALMKERDQPINTVANTIFPASLYLPEKLGEKAAAHFYKQVAEGSTVTRRHKSNRCGRYIDRMLEWEGNKGTVNQLEMMVKRLKGQMRRNNPWSSWYETALIAPEDFCETDGDLRIQEPTRDTQPMHFPCLSHISFTLREGKLNLAAMYRNQHFFRKAYGNYVGLSRLMRFLSTEAGCEQGELLCIATHADAELGIRKLDSLIIACREGMEKAS